ncbi:stress responsive protein [Azorhizobium oxalatiphilum]|uniref:Stress responsive protein n=1 Tax=Azorhizobium oxalatiphilum TaxID=980631 RepID=A0A917FF07_9HYPH|nr:Dabb family protein [Azorhizobium oxalatiphilum]GGF71636.1 stress responsive protein [Azorhizobium oxalatiphilum]
MTGPIRHIVMWRVSGNTREERDAARLKVKTAFEGLRGRIDGMTHVEVGLDMSDVDYACDVVLVSEFETPADLEAYATHPEHLRVRQELADLRIARFQVDYLVGAPADAAVSAVTRHQDQLIASA